MRLDGLQGVGGATRVKAAVAAEQRAQEPLVAGQESEKDPL
jgi:hypothetical protein